MTHGTVAQKNATANVRPKVVFALEKNAWLNAEQLQERKKKLEEYLRMCSVLRTLQHAVYKLKKRFTSTFEQNIMIDDLSVAADNEYKQAIFQAKSWLRKRVSQSEFLQLVARQQKKVYDDSEDCSNTIKRLLKAQASAQVNNIAESASLNIPASSSGNDHSPVRMDTKGLNESVECDMWNLSARSLRRNLDARREQAEMLNRSFEERTRDIENQTKKSIAAQIMQYDRVISERTTLLSKLDEISSKENAEKLQTPTPRRAGVEPLDLSQLSPKEVSADEEKAISSMPEILGNLQNPSSEDYTDVGINRTCSQSTVYEDSLSHFDEEEDKRPDSASSEGTLYQSDLDNEASKTIDNGMNFCMIHS
ncbi:unnamed protein product [Strongylus vulgaris]|uniref:Uncharacterized protein n=1 Tax=Strongylus vulgaris TaxID=40348 RepID=A0A3P7IBR2_STRVU|nr:unnamed protein product [Strongylus vulgaris]